MLGSGSLILRVFIVLPIGLRYTDKYVSRFYNSALSPHIVIVILQIRA
ncbi:hypothetical protein SAMN05216315_11322 [Nitrosospira sp. Nsp18]|nr:hypothetical protein SAMN05216315_11322 [Nitrosospira sp. Nsp18]